jgi:sec-independent protein translocase protein TatC
MSDRADAGAAADADDIIGEESEPVDERSRMSFLDHLDELRRRIIYSLYALIACCAVTLYFWDDMFVYLTNYFRQYGGTLIYTRPMAGFVFSMKIGLLAGALLASPFVFAQIWLFISPGLYRREKRIAIPFVLSSTILFAAGATFAHLVAWPAMWKFFASYDGMGGLQYFPNLEETFSLWVKILLGLGLVFQLPLMVYILARFGIVTARYMIKQYKYAVLIIVIVAAVITPTADVVTLTIFAAPMLLLYAVSIGVAWMFGRPRAGVSER